MNLKICMVDAVAYWERKRLLYNAILVALTLLCWGPDIIMGGPRDWIGGGLVLLMFAIIANALFCFAYPVDLAFQLSPLRTMWASTRWVLFLFGLILASAIALQVMLGTGMA